MDKLHFNPHFRKGSDHADPAEKEDLKHISIHTSAREVTMRQAVDRMDMPISIHTSAREVTKLQKKDADRIRISIHTSAREVTP